MNPLPRCKSNACITYLRIAEPSFRLLIARILSLVDHPEIAMQWNRGLHFKIAKENRQLTLVTPMALKTPPKFWITSYAEHVQNRFFVSHHHRSFLQSQPDVTLRKNRALKRSHDRPRAAR